MWGRRKEETHPEKREGKNPYKGRNGSKFFAECSSFEATISHKHNCKQMQYNVPLVSLPTKT
jgi:hypothetical protein